METLKISKVGQEKQVQTKFGLKTKVGVQFEEIPDTWHDVWASGLQVGQTLTGERISREWEGKTYWNFNLAKKDDKVNAKLEEILTKLGRLQFSVDRLAEKQSPSKPPVIDNYPEDINPDDIPL